MPQRARLLLCRFSSQGQLLWGPNAPTSPFAPVPVFFTGPVALEVILAMPTFAPGVNSFSALFDLKAKFGVVKITSEATQASKSPCTSRLKRVLVQKATSCVEAICQQNFRLFEGTCFWGAQTAGKYLQKVSPFHWQLRLFEVSCL